eukprot:scaffold198199_cov31-Tisochrysis_lutea.AAC.1
MSSPDKRVGVFPYRAATCLLFLIVEHVAVLLPCAEALRTGGAAPLFVTLPLDLKNAPQKVWSAAVQDWPCTPSRAASQQVQPPFPIVLPRRPQPRLLTLPVCARCLARSLEAAARVYLPVPREHAHVLQSGLFLSLTGWTLSLAPSLSPVLSISELTPTPLRLPLVSPPSLSPFLPLVPRSHRLAPAPAVAARPPMDPLSLALSGVSTY